MKSHSKNSLGLSVILVAGAILPGFAFANPSDATPASPPALAVAETKPSGSGTSGEDKPAPLPLHQIEGNGGIFVTQSAYIVNPPRNGEAIGRPSIGAAFVDLGSSKNLEALTITESPHERLELGYGWDRLGLGDLPLALRNAGITGYHQNEVQLHNVNARVQLVSEGDFSQKWLPAITVGTHYKYNDGISTVNSQTGGALASAGITKSSSTDFTLYASKLFTQLPIPVLVQVGARATEGVWDGLGGFTDRYNFVVEGNVVAFVTDNLALAAEYKQQPHDYKAIGDLVRKADDWWTLDVAYVVNKHYTVAVGYGHFGALLNHNANGVWGVTNKFEF